METSDTVDIANKDKKPVERSAAYPGITIQEAADFVALILKNFPGSQKISREDIAAVLKKSVSNIQRDIAAAVHYKLLDRDKEGYRVSGLYKTIHNPISEKEKLTALLEAFGAPKLYAELIERHDGHVVPSELKTHLIRFHKIIDKAAPLAAEIFIEGGKYLGVINEHNILNYRQTLNTVQEGNAELHKPTNDAAKSKISEQNKINHQTISGKASIIAPVQTAPVQLLIEEMNNAEEKKIRLSEGKFAVWKYPKKLSQKDIEIFRKELEILELLVE